MALNFNSVEPTQIIAKDGNSVQTFVFPSGTKTTDIFMADISGYNTAQATFTSTHNFTANTVICNGIVLNSSDKLIHQETTKTDIEDDDYLTWSFYASFKDNVISLEQIAQRRFKKELNLTSVTLHGKTYSAGFYSATDLTVLKYGDTAVWGKPFSLTIQAGANSTVTVNRTSSPNQHASTGNITSGGIVYYGDTLTITATPASGYKLTKFTINGTEYASGQTSAVSQTITVTSAISIDTTTESAAGWKTVWTGSKVVSVWRVRTGSFQGLKGYSGSATVTQEIISNTYPTRISYDWGSEGIPKNTELNTTVETISTGDSGHVLAKLSTSSNNIDFTTTVYGSKPNAWVFYGGPSITLTKVEQYY